MTGKLLGAAAAGLLVSACAHAYPDLATFKSVSTNEPSDELGPILAEAERLQATYSTGYKETARWQDISQLPIIGAAAAAAWILLENHEHAATRAGKIGIGALTYKGARDQLTSPGLPGVYIKGHGALTCILAEGSMFHGQKADQRYESLEDYLGEVEVALNDLSVLRYTEPTDSKNQEMLKAARAVADQAIATARAANTAGLNQAGIHDNAAPAFRKAVSSVSVSVASKGRERVPVDFASIRDSMAAPKAEGVRATENGEAEIRKHGSAELIQDLARDSSELMALTARLTAATPDYSRSIKNLEDCVKQAQ